MSFNYQDRVMRPVEEESDLSFVLDGQQNNSNPNLSFQVNEPQRNKPNPHQTSFSKVHFSAVEGEVGECDS